MIKWERGEVVWDTDRAKWKQLTDELRRRIREGVYKPRYPVPSLNQLEQEFALTKNTIRKAIVQLSLEGYIRAEHGVGTFVRPRNEWPAEDE